MSARPPKRRSARQLADRKQRSIYYEPDSDELDVGESDGEFDELPDRPIKRRKLSRRNKPQTRSSAQLRRENKPGRPKLDRPKAKSKSNRRSKTRRPFSKQLGTPIKLKEKHDLVFKGPSDGRTPAWTTLPLEILRDIFIYASQPMQEQTTTASANVTWLMRSARTCRNFAVPALEAYYQSPYPLTNLQPHHLLELLLMPKDKTYLDYSVKVRSLAIDIRRLAYTATGKSRLDLSLLVQQLPQLQHFQVFHPNESSPYRDQQKIQRWQYPADLFQALDVSGARLKSWRWSHDLIPTSEDMDVYAYMSLAHTSKSFEYIERLVICGYDANDTIPYASEDDPAARMPRLAALISQLPHIRGLAFISCDCVMEKFLEHLPKDLERLELSNCLEVTSDMLRSYMAAGGSHLKELVLNHNPALSLAFLPPLQMLCPRLEVLKMDFTYYSERYNFNDAWAMYDQLLTEDETPTWPTTMRHLELVNLQKWTAEAAQNLFRSLVDGAKDLPELRHLVIQAHINIPWRDRAGFRDQWIERLNRVYLRKSEGPIPYLGSLKQYRLWKKAQAEGLAIVDPANLDSDEERVTRRRLSHIRVTPRKAPIDADIYPEAGSSAEKPRQAARRSVRVAEREESQNASTAAEEEESSSESEDEGGDEWRKEPEAFIQGLCKVVDIRIDNQRPRENQYTEANFLDSEPSGDEDWHSGAELEDDGYAW